MDAEFTRILRLVQLSGQGFSKLNLENVLSETGLKQLLREVVIAQMKQAGVEIHQYHSAEELKKINASQPQDRPRRFISQTPEKCLGHYFCPSMPVTWETLPEALIPSLATVDWKKHSYVSEFYNPCPYHPTLHPYGDEAVFTGKLLLIQLHDATEKEWSFHVGYRWQETPASFERYRLKKLRERGLVPGRNG